MKVFNITLQRERYACRLCISTLMRGTAPVSHVRSQGYDGCVVLLYLIQASASSLVSVIESRPSLIFLSDVFLYCLMSPSEIHLLIPYSKPLVIALFRRHFNCKTYRAESLALEEGRYVNSLNLTECDLT